MRTFVLVLALVMGCGGKGAGTAARDDKALYDRIGGRDVILAIVDDFVARVAADPRIKHMFVDANVPELKEKLADQLCEASGGPCKYIGKNLRDAHAGMGVTDPQFDALVEDLRAALAAANLGAAEQRELLTAVGATTGDVVTTP